MGGTPTLAPSLAAPPTRPGRQFFQSGKTLPIERGAGPDQPVMRTVAKQVALGHWLHIFPEGRINYTGDLGPLRWGVGKLVCEAVGRHRGRWAHGCYVAVLPRVPSRW